MNDIKIPEKSEKNAVLGGALYLVGTPIGNLSDISERAKKVLSEVSFVAAEDTRVSGAMLARYGISRPLFNYFEHNKKSAGEQILSRLSAGESCALVTDAGMPAISDPGEELVKLCAENNIPVFVVPGPCAAVSALALSALPSGKFAFYGFLPTDGKTRRETLCELAEEKKTILLYEAPHRLLKTLGELLESLGDRKIALCRELTKINEEVIRTTVSEAVSFYGSNAPRGEYVLVIEGGSGAADAFRLQMSIEEHVGSYVKLGMSKNDAIKAAARDRGVSKSEIYNKIMIKD